jgi:quercetin dioxygenase-like cupin family protein
LSHNRLFCHDHGLGAAVGAREAALLYGDPAKEGPFVLRLRFPANYQIPPHRHPGAEILTVVSGTFMLGSGETADKAKAQAMPSGGFTAMPPNMAHYAHTDEVTVVQINSMGPWSINYVNPNDDPRRQPQ